MKVIDNICIRKNEWDKLEDMYEGQSNFFKLFSQNGKKGDCEYYRFYENDICQMECLIAYIYYDKSSVGKKAEQLIKGRLNGTIQILDGPMLKCEDSKCEYWTDIFFEFIFDLIKKKKMRSVRIERTKFPINTIENMTEKLQNQRMIVKKWATIIVDLSQDEQILKTNLKHSARLGINKGHRCGLNICEIKSDDAFFDDFVTSLSQFKGIKKEAIIDKKIRDWEVAKVTRRKRHYLVKQGNLILGTVCLGIFEREVIIENFAYNNVVCRELKLPASDFLIWEVMLKMKAEGCVNFNLAGVSPEPSSKKENGIRNFKEKWGGKYVEYYDFYFEPVLFTAIKKLYRRYVDNK